MTAFRFRRSAGLALLTLLLALPGRAEAHTTVQGMSSFMTGALHPLMTPAHGLLLLALGLGLGQHVPFRLGPALRIFIPVSAVGLALTTTGRIPAIPLVVLSALALAAGANVALARRVPALVTGLLLALSALAIGLDSGVETGTPLAIAGTLCGTWAGLNVYLINIAYYVALAAEKEKQWVNIAIRVAGSWIVAISLLMLAFSLRK